jgi:hypothetical protein
MNEVVRSDHSAVPAFLPVRFCGPPPEPDVPVAGHPALHKPRRGWVGSGLARPRGGDCCSPVAVAGGPHPSGVKQRYLAIGRPPAAVAEASTQLLPSHPGCLRRIHPMTRRQVKARR